MASDDSSLFPRLAGASTAFDAEMAEHRPVMIGILPANAG
jgi:hypothetical protein